MEKGSWGGGWGGEEGSVGVHISHQPPNPGARSCSRAGLQQMGTGMELGSSRLANPWPGAGVGSSLILLWGHPGQSRAWVYLQHLAALVPPPDLVSAT